MEKRIFVIFNTSVKLMMMLLMIYVFDYFFLFKFFFFSLICYCTWINMFRVVHCTCTYMFYNRNENDCDTQQCIIPFRSKKAQVFEFAYVNLIFFTETSSNVCSIYFVNLKSFFGMWMEYKNKFFIAINTLFTQNSLTPHTSKFSTYPSYSLFNNERVYLWNWKSKNPRNKNID